MNPEPTVAKRSRKSRWRLIAGLGFGVVLVGGLAFVALAPRDPLFHGKPESYWITNIAYGMSLTGAQNKQQVQRWRDFGPEGLRVLERGLAVNRGQTYRNVYRRASGRLPAFIVKLLPSPRQMTDLGTRQCILD